MTIDGQMHDVTDLKGLIDLIIGFNGDPICTYSLLILIE